MIIRLPDDYFFHSSDEMKRKTKSYFSNSLFEDVVAKNENEEDVYSFKFADDEYVKEATK